MLREQNKSTARAKAEIITEVRRKEAVLKTGALQNAILTSAIFSSIATDTKGIIQILHFRCPAIVSWVSDTTRRCFNARAHSH